MFDYNLCNHYDYLITMADTTCFVSVSQTCARDIPFVL